MYWCIAAPSIYQNVILISVCATMTLCIKFEHDNITTVSQLLLNLIVVVSVKLLK